MQAITALVEETLASGLGSAMAVSVGAGGREVFRLVRGHERRVPDLGAAIDELAWFDVASLTKPMVTAACAMVLVGEGRLDLDAPVRTWLPDAASAGSVRELLGHAAGCAAHVEFFRLMRDRVQIAGELDARAELVTRALAEPAGPPGITAVYSDLGYIMLGEIIARATALPLERAFAELVAEPLGLAARYVPAGSPALAGAVATELDLPGSAPLPAEPAGFPRSHAGRGLVSGRVHDENAWYGGGVFGHAGLFARIDDVATFAAAIVDTAAGTARGRFVPAVVQHFLGSTAAPGTSWRLGWDTPAVTPGVSQAGDRWPRSGSAGHLGFTGTSMWLDLQARRWCVVLTNRVHPSRHGGSAEAVKALRRAVNDAALAALAAG